MEKKETLSPFVVPQLCRSDDESANASSNDDSPACITIMGMVARTCVLLEEFIVIIQATEIGSAIYCDAKSMRVDSDSTGKMTQGR